MQSKTLVWAHRGASGYAPENTIASFEKAVELGADGVELDVQLSKDGELVVIHDEKTDRVSGFNGWVKDQTLSELKKLNVSLPMESYAKSTQIPTLKEVLELLKPSGLSINVELKTGIIRYEGIEEKVLALITELDMLDKIWISSFNHESVCHFKKLCPEMKCGLLFGDVMVNPYDYTKELGIDALHPALYHFAMDPGYIAKAKSYGFETHIWTVNEREHMEKLVSENVEAIITNYPDIARKVVDGR